MRNRLVFVFAAGLAASGAAYAQDCPGDCDGNGVANILDFVCFQGEFADQSPAGDCDGNGQFNILDFVCFQTAFQDFSDGNCDQGGNDFFDDFDSYEAGSSICGQGGWDPWALNPDVCGVVSDAQAFSAPNSLLIVGASGPAGDDTVQLFDIEGGQWTFSVQTFVPDEAAGQAYVILLNTYDHGPGVENWSLQVQFDADLGTVMAEFDGEIALLQTGEWIEFKAEIDLDADSVDYYYDGTQFVFDKSWIDGLSGGGQPTIQCLDLYGQEPGIGTTGMFFDDVSLTEGIN